eukprot:SM000635S19850  [mRNA]  locus=s635:2:2358:- [translate_table: standard]
MPLDALPDEVVITILSLLAASAVSTADLVNARLTCRRMYELGRDDMVLRCVSAEGLAVPLMRWTSKAEAFLKLCVLASNPNACHMLGMIYFYCGDDREGGAALLTQAAIAGHVGALHALAIIQFNGSGGTRNDRNAAAGVVLCATAAKRGHVEALRELGHCLQDGYGVQQDIVEGRRLLIEANLREAAHERERANALLCAAMSAVPRPAAGDNEQAQQPEGNVPAGADRSTASAVLDESSMAAESEGTSTLTHAAGVLRHSEEQPIEGLVLPSSRPASLQPARQTSKLMRTTSPQAATVAAAAASAALLSPTAAAVSAAVEALTAAVVPAVEVAGAGAAAVVAAGAAAANVGEAHNHHPAPSTLDEEPLEAAAMPAAAATSGGASTSAAAPAPAAGVWHVESPQRMVEQLVESPLRMVEQLTAVAAPAADASPLRRLCALLCPLLSDFGCAIPATPVHPAHAFLVSWAALLPPPPGLKACGSLRCGRREMRAHEFRCCSACGLPSYCSRGCQALDWKEGHLTACRAAVEAAHAAAAELFIQPVAPAQPPPPPP